jgi:hypothetical protein
LNKLSLRNRSAKKLDFAEELSPAPALQQARRAKNSQPIDELTNPPFFAAGSGSVQMNHNNLLPVAHYSKRYKHTAVHWDLAVH